MTKSICAKALFIVASVYLLLLLLSSICGLIWYDKEMFESSLKKIGNLRVVSQSQAAHESIFYSWLVPPFGKWKSGGPQKIVLSFYQVDEEPSSIQGLQLFIHHESKWKPLAIENVYPSTIGPKTPNAELHFQSLPVLSIERSKFLKVRYPGISQVEIAAFLLEKGLTQKHVDLYLSGVSDKTLNSYYAPRHIVFSTVDFIPIQQEIKLKLKFDLVDSASSGKTRILFDLKKLRREGLTFAFAT